MGDGLCVFVEVKAFSSRDVGMTDVEAVEELRWRVPGNLIRRANASRSPVVMFLFDADSGHGRYARLDQLVAEGTNGTLQTVTFRKVSEINDRNLRRLIRELSAQNHA